MKLLNWLDSLRRQRLRQRPARRRRRNAHWSPTVLESLEERLLLSVSSTFDVATGRLLIQSNDADSIQLISRSSTQTIELNGHNVMVSGTDQTPRPLRGSELQSLQIIGGPGDNRIDLSQLAIPVAPNLQGVRLDGGDGDDTLIGTALADTLNGGRGDDSLVGQAGNDALLGGSGIDTLVGGAGDDFLKGHRDSNFLSGGPGTDTVVGDRNVDVVFDSADVDFVLTDTALDGHGYDKLINIEMAKLTGGDGDNRIDATAFSGPVTLQGGGGNDVLLGTNQDDFLNGGDGSDSLHGHTGADLLNGGRGNDVLFGDGGNDMLFGGADADSLSGGLGNDYLAGQGGSRDTLTGNAGDDTLDGGTGSDDMVYEFGDADYLLTDRELVGIGTDALRNIESATLIAGPGNNSLRATAFSGDTRLIGAEGNDRLYGGSGRDVLLGGEGEDWLVGNRGDNTLVGESGRDTVFGDRGVDVVIQEAIAPGVIPDVVFDLDNDDTLLRDDSNLILQYDVESTDAFYRFVPSLEELRTLSDSIGPSVVWVDGADGGTFFRDDTLTPASEEPFDRIVGTTDGVTWQRMFEPRQGYLVDWFGAVGDGKADDSLAIQAAIDAAGEGGIVRFLPGSTYRTTRAITPLARQTLRGYDATLLRADESKATTTTVFTPVVVDGWYYVDVTVDDASDFSIGMPVTVFRGSVFQSKSLIVTHIDGNQLRLRITGLPSDFELLLNSPQAFPMGSTLVSTFNQIEITHLPEVKILGLTLDGNGRANDSLRRWELHSAIRTYSENGLVQDVVIRDAQADAIIVGGDHNLIQNNTIESAAGNGIHLSGGDGIQIFNNTVKNTNLAGSRVGHVGGAIEFSAECPNSIIMGNYFENNRAGVAGFDTPHPDGTVIKNNTIVNAREYALDAVAVNFTEQGSMVFSGNRVLNSKLVAFSNINITADANSPPSVVVADNYFEGTRLFVVNSRFITFRGNQWAGGIGPSSSVMMIDDSLDISIDDQIEGGAVGVYVRGALSRRITVSGTFLNNRQAAVNFERSVSNQIDSRINGAVILAEAGKVSDRYVGLLIREGIAATNNILTLQTGRYGIWMIGGGPNQPGAIATGNTIRSPQGVISIRINEEGQNHVVTGNNVEQKIVDASGLQNTILDNVRIESL